MRNLKNMSAEGKTPENMDGEELIRNLGKINVIPEEEIGKAQSCSSERI